MDFPGLELTSATLKNTKADDTFYRSAELGHIGTDAWIFIVDERRWVAP